MPLWDVKLPRWNGGNFTSVTPLEVLAELDEPLTFTFTDSNGSLMRAHLCSVGMDRLRYIVAPTSPRILHALKTGAGSVHSPSKQQTRAAHRTFIPETATLPARERR
jgi:hypothetical protein